MRLKNHGGGSTRGSWRDMALEEDTFTLAMDVPGWRLQCLSRAQERGWEARRAHGMRVSKISHSVQPHQKLSCLTVHVLSDHVAWLVSLTCQPTSGKDSTQPGFLSNALP